MVRSIVVIHDVECGGCSAIATRLSDVLAPPVLVRSCRDPHLVREFPVLRRYLTPQPCGGPLAITVHSDGRTEVVHGLRMIGRGATLLAPRRKLAALRLALEIGWVRLAHRRRAR